MKLSTPSHAPSARARKKSSSSAVRSGNSVKTKSLSSSAGLTIRTPQDSKLRRLAEMGLVVPDVIPSDDDAIPLDFTLVSNQEIGAIHSRYAVRHAHAIYNAALVGQDLGMLRRDLRVAQARFRMSRPKQPKNITDAEMEDDERI